MAFVSVPSHQQQDDYLKSLASLAAVANEDDMTDMLYVDFAKQHDRPFVINEAEYLAESLTPLSTPSTGAQTPVFDHDDDEAVLSDLPFDTSDSELEIPPSPPTGQRRHRGATSLGEDDFEFPVFLGRQSMDEGAGSAVVEEDKSRRPVPAGPMRPMLPRAAPLPVATKALGTATAAAAIAAAAPAVPELSGPMMAWWPAPVESLQYDWVDAPPAAPSKAVPVEHHVADLEGPLMAWWPAPAELMEYEWKEKFYE